MNYEPLHSQFGFDSSLVADIVDPEISGAEDTIANLRYLSSIGLLDLGVAGESGLELQMGVISAVARHSLSVAFSAWAHRMVNEYVAASQVNDGLRLALADGDIIGSTAMAAGLRAHLGLARVGLTATPTENGYEITGTIPWASNLYEGKSVVVAAAEKPKDGHVVVVFAVNGERVHRGSSPQLLALQATASGRLIVDRVEVGAHQILSENLKTFLAQVRPVFMLLQSAFAIGLGEAALEAVDGPLEGDALVLAEDTERLSATHHRLAAGARAAIRGDLTGLGLVGFRLDAARFAQAAVAVEAQRRGGRGYLAGSDTARRLREAAFLPIQSPTETQLRWELACSA